jgi:curved DNA-binding protein CbpA
MSLEIQRGLFKFNLIDHHAILGVTVEAEIKEIRQRYKEVARLLHPDSCSAVSQKEKEQAVQLFSKLVSPAYAQLSKERYRSEYILNLFHMGKVLAQEAAKVQIKSKAANQLAQANGKLENVYSSYVNKLASMQYSSYDKVLDAIAILSELNMVYLIRKEKNGQVINQSVINNGTLDKNSSEKIAVQEHTIQAASPADPYLRRAKENIANNNWPKAVVELRDALTLEPNNSSCHSLLGMAYLKQNLTTMAKIHINKALQLNPTEPKALQGKEILDKLAEKAAGSKTTPPAKPNSDNSKDGLFGGLFGAKKK